jgi:hypothetical protein
MTTSSLNCKKVMMWTREKLRKQWRKTGILFMANDHVIISGRLK